MPHLTFLIFLVPIKNSISKCFLIKTILLEFSISLFPFNNHYGFAKWNYFCHTINMKLPCSICSHFQTKLSQNPTEYVLFIMTDIKHISETQWCSNTVLIDTVQIIVLNNKYVTPVSKYFKLSPIYFMQLQLSLLGPLYRLSAIQSGCSRTNLSEYKSEQFAICYKFKVLISSL